MIRISLLFFMPTLFVCGSLLATQSPLGDLQQEHDPGKRSELALVLADESFDNAREFYLKGSMDQGNAALENMTSVLTVCVQSLEVSNKTKFYKRAELKVAFLQRRMGTLVEDLAVEERGWAEQTKRKLEEIHDKILAGVMRK